MQSKPQILLCQELLTARIDSGIHGVLRSFAIQDCSQVLGGRISHLIAGFDRGATDVWGEDCVFEFEEFRVHSRFFFVNVEAGGEDAAFF